MRRRRHPLSGAIYEVRSDGNLDVTLGSKSGIFTPDGDYVSGDLHHADPHLCGWLAGNQVPGGVNPKDLRAQTPAPTGGTR